MRFGIRATTQGDTTAVAAVLKGSYPVLLAPAYDPALLAKALPLMTRANPVLLASGTYYLAEAADGTPVGCGGWTFERPGAPDDPIDPALAHIRHFATHPDWTGRGIGRALFERCLADAGAAGACRFEAWSTLVAEAFYRRMGFETIDRFEVAMGPEVRFPSVRMVRGAAGDSA